MGTKTINQLTSLTDPVATGDLVPLYDTSGAVTRQTTIAKVIDAVEANANTFTAANVFSGLVTASRIITGTITNLADDTVTTITPPANAGMILFSPSNAFSSNRNEAMALIGYLLSVPAIQVLAQPATRVTVGTSVLAGTTGTDGTLNIGGVAGPLIYVENRLGVTISLTYIILL